MYVELTWHPERFSPVPGCTYACLESPRHTGRVGCCHTCAYYLQAACRAPEGWGYYPRALVRELREA